MGWTLSPQAQAPSEPALRAAFLYNFAKFTDWPEDHLAPAAPLHFCIADAPVAEALEATVAGRSIGQHALVVTRVKAEEILNSCAVLYAGNLDAKRTEQLLAPLNGVSVLSVGDSSKFILVGGIIRLFADNGQLRFAINVDAAGRAKLRLSSQLLALATIVKDAAGRGGAPGHLGPAPPCFAGFVKD